MPPWDLGHYAHHAGGVDLYVAFEGLPFAHAHGACLGRGCGEDKESDHGGDEAAHLHVIISSGRG